jgi:hypothetical protein
MMKIRTPGGGDNYEADFTHHSGAGDLDVSFIALSGNPPVSKTFYFNRHMAIGGMLPDSLPVRNEQGAKALLYTSAPLEEGTEVTGHPLVHLWVSSTADYGDLYFYLEDVDENGRAIQVTDYQIRLGFNNLVDNDRMINSGADGIEVKPELPWHGFTSGDYTAERRRRKAPSKQQPWLRLQVLCPSSYLHLPFAKRLASEREEKGPCTETRPPPAVRLLDAFLHCALLRTALPAVRITPGRVIHPPDFKPLGAASHVDDVIGVPACAGVVNRAVPAAAARCGGLPVRAAAGASRRAGICGLRPSPAAAAP